MGPGILIALLVGFASALAAPDSTAQPSLSAPPADSARRDSSRSARVRVPLAPAWKERASSWEIPARAGSAGGALVQAFRDGAQALPWRDNFEFDGMFETWTPWTGFPLEERLSRASWDGPSLSGAGDAGPLAGSAILEQVRRGLGGVPVREILPDPVPSDTPSTGIHFYRAALASYRFGLDFSRAIWGPWGLRVATETRSAQTRSWMYRDQIQDLFQGSFGRSREDLPAQGRSPGQDDQQWEIALVRGDSTSRLDLGWTWVDLRRGIPDPRKTWNGGDRAPFPGKDARSGFFGTWVREREDWTVRARWRAVEEHWNWMSWSDSGGPVPVSGNELRQTGDLSVRRELGGSGIGLRLQGLLVSGDRSVPLLSTDVDEDQERGAVFFEGRSGRIGWNLEAGWSRLSTTTEHLVREPDWSASLTVGDSAANATVSGSRQVAMPDASSERPDPVLRTVPVQNLEPELQDLGQARASIGLGGGLRLEAGAAFLAREDARQPLAVPRAGAVASRSDAFRLANVGNTQGGSGDLGLSWKGGRWRARSDWALGWTGLPGRGLSSADPRLPRWNGRSNLGWGRELLDGRLRLRFDADVRSIGESWAWTSPSSDTTARAVRQPPSNLLDLEMQVGIRTFLIDWWIENLLDQRRVPAPGWTPPGIRAGWGITWSFGG